MELHVRRNELHADVTLDAIVCRGEVQDLLK
jgi:hypothetical protein